MPELCIQASPDFAGDCASVMTGRPEGYKAFWQGRAAAVSNIPIFAINEYACAHGYDHLRVHGYVQQVLAEYLHVHVLLQAHVQLRALA